MYSNYGWRKPNPKASPLGECESSPSSAPANSCYASQRLLVQKTILVLELPAFHGGVTVCRILDFSSMLLVQTPESRNFLKVMACKTISSLERFCSIKL